jgi:4'-phosphopantetheinyl transferase
VRRAYPREQGAIAIVQDALGKPSARVGERGAPVALSISHAFPFALAVATRDDVALGVDIERIRDFSEHTWRAFLTPAEKEFIAAAPKARRRELRTLAWSLKEAVLKALGVGLRMHPAHVDIAPFLESTGDRQGTVQIRGISYDARAQTWREGSTHVAAAVALSAAAAYDEAIPAHAAMDLS